MKNSAFFILVACLVISIHAMAQAPAALWIKTYDGPAHRGDMAAGCALDGSGSLYVTGYSQHAYGGGDALTIKYNTTTGDTVWTSRYSDWTGRPSDTSPDLFGNACAVDRSGNLYVAGQTFGPRGYDLLLVKYNPATGAILWAKTYDSGKDDLASGCTTEVSGSIYVVGASNYSGSNDFLVMKYTTNGDTLWSRRYDGSAHRDDQALACAVDKSSNLYVTGYSYTGSHYTLLIIKYNSSGDTLWTRRSNDVLDSLAHPSAGCAVDSAGNVYVTGMCGVQSGFGNRYSVTIKYNSSGTILWTSHYDSPTVYDQTIACAVDSKNNLYAVGTTYNGTNDDWLIIKYNSSNGDTLWTIKRNGSGNGSDYATGCTLDASGNLYIAGFTNFYHSDTTGDYLVIKYQSTVTSVEGRTHDLPGDFFLFQNYPNPFNPSTIISYSLPEAANVSLRVFNTLGQEVAVLVNEQRSPGYFQVQWNANAPSGIYFYRLQTGEFVDTKKMVILH